MAYGSSQDVEIAALGACIPGLFILACFVQAAVVVIPIFIFMYLLCRGWGKVVLLLGSSVGCYYLHTVKVASDGVNVVIKDGGWGLLAVFCAAFLVLAWVVITTRCFFMISAESELVAFVLYLPLIFLTVVACFWLSGIDVMPFVDLPEQINYAGFAITKG